MNIGQRILTSNLFQSMVSRGLALYIRLCWRTTRWQVEGRAELEARLREGPVILCLWHEHLMIAPVAWGRRHAMCTIAQNAHAGRLAGEVMERLGLQNRNLDAKVSNVTVTRDVVRLAKGGSSIGLAVDGPDGPRRAAKSVPILWARATGLPLWGFAFELPNPKRLNTWDKMILPRPFGRGRVVFRPVMRAVPRKLDAQATEALVADLQGALNVMTAPD